MQTCAACRKEYDLQVSSLKVTRSWLNADRVDWNESEWKDLIHRAVGKKAGTAPSRSIRIGRRIWAYAAALVLIVGMSLLVSLPWDRVPETKTLEARNDQEIVSMTFIAQDTGVRINWFFNKNFKLEDNK